MMGRMSNFAEEVFDDALDNLGVDTEIEKEGLKF